MSGEKKNYSRYNVSPGSLDPFDAILNGDKKVEEVVEVSDQMWRHEPVSPIVFMEEYLNTKTLSNAQKFVLYGVFGDNPSEKFFNVEQAILKIGQGGGKNFLVTRMVVYAIYLWCCLEDPHRYFDAVEDEPFDILNYSQVNAQQAKNVFFKSLANVISLVKDPDSGKNWFVEHMGFRLKEFRTTARGDIKDEEMVIPNRIKDHGDIRIYCLDSTATSVEGYKIWMAIGDEPSRADTTIKYEKAKKQWSTAHTNQETRFSNVHHRLMLVFAYPEQQVNDLIVYLYNLYSVNSVENTMEIVDYVLTAWYAAYIFTGKDADLKLELYKKAYKQDPIDADRRWRAIVPPNVYGFFMPHYSKIDDCANPKLISPVEYKRTMTVRNETVKGIPKDVTYSALELLSVKGDDRDRWWAGDFATNKDRLVITGGYAEALDREVDAFTYSYRDENGIEIFKEMTINVRPVIDIVLVWEPIKPGWPIDYQNVEDVILFLLGKKFPNSRALHFDMWNTESIRQKVLDIGVGNCEKLSFSNPMQLLYAKTVRHLVWNNAIEYIDHPIVKREMHELILEGNHKITHPSTGGKDTWDTVSIVTNLIMEFGHKGSLFDIDVGEDTEADSEGELMLVLFNRAMKKFVASKDRNPESAEEMQMYLKEIFQTEWRIAQVNMVHQSWLTWRNTIRGKIASAGISGRTLERGSSAEQSLIDDLGQATSLEDDIRALERGGRMLP